MAPALGIMTDERMMDNYDMVIWMVLTSGGGDQGAEEGVTEQRGHAGEVQQPQRGAPALQQTGDGQRCDDNVTSSGARRLEWTRSWPQLCATPRYRPGIIS